ncbi:DUF1405 domain-containing protein [Paenibacillus sp. LMG 31456]|uniref:DUF1405 domain-containing protein n=1 Tax=Paenibacillus foliorum TaxID=2654974 RepID=A0A972H2N3_9BACL|nr:DUF1405 domain-containing protein [Paenibacillus foliorum]NOU97530.1 DUF1405 domain-containing protein [Paenibacillus foliorum]
MSFKTYFSKAFLSSRFMLWSLFWINLLGTIYGYQWYWKQMTFTAETMSSAYLPFVPDSPTASLFFTGAIGFLLVDSYRKQSAQPSNGWIRGIVEAFAVITSFKYGIWAVSMIWAGVYQGDSLNWQDWMLTISHLGMAAEALLYLRLYTYRSMSILVVAAWTFLNDYMDYGYGVYPWLPESLEDDLYAVAAFTVELSFVSVIVAYVMMKIRLILAKREL